ncbi:MAG: hypothetical protein J6Q13_03470 [Clostridia bacterium]|nr:hypothetical protein [Clostridia bacterium]
MQDFTLNDIRDFMLSELLVNWFGEIFDDEKGVYRHATEEDFKILKTTKFQVKDLKEDKLFDLKVVLCGNTFNVVRGEDLTLKWINFKNKREKENVADIFGK